MKIESSLLPKEDLKKQWFKTSNFYRLEDKQSSIIFIGDAKADSFKRYNKPVYTVPNFAEAKQQIAASAVKNIYKVDVIDTPLAIARLEKFSSFLRENTNAVIIYSVKKLTINEAKFLKAFDLVDDVINLELNNLDLVVKNVIEKRGKTNQKRLLYKTKELHLQGKKKAKDFSFFLKKAFDISTAAVLILLLSPLFILIGIAIRYDSKGPVFYSSLRAGKGYKIFKFYKFRTMVKDADKKMGELVHLNQYNLGNDGPTFFKLDNDPRVTRVGRFLRNTSLDELPQLFNILLGNMSLVGNRPLPLYEAATLTTNDFVERFTAPAGMTGFWQIKKRGKAEMSVKERVDLDIAYARKASPIFDLYIMANTPAALFQKSDV
ncbi:MAG TPA: sugar transferase [Segetibacter sp.]